MIIALDAMGGDFAPAVTVEGAVESVNEKSDIDIILIGNESAIKKELAGRKYPHGRLHIMHASQVVEMNEPAVHAVKKKKDSSIRRATDLVRNREADAVVSAGHSGVAMATSLLLLGTSEGVDRPAIATVMPTLKGPPFVLIDVGANVDCNAENLFQFALMGDAYCRTMFEMAKPRIALLSIGEEDSKGNLLTKEAFKLLKNQPIGFIGNIEGKDIFTGNADVVVCDGFTGNIVLKTSEGLVETMMKMLKREISELTASRVGYLLLKPALRNFRKKTDYAEYGGAPLLGINGTSIISHGRSSAKAIRNAVRVAAEFSRKQVYKVIAEEINSFHLKKVKNAQG